MFTVMLVLGCVAAYIAVWSRGKDSVQNLLWARRNGTLYERALARFDLIRIIGTALWVVAISLLFIARGGDGSADGILRWVSDGLLIAGMFTLSLATWQLRVAYRIDREIRKEIREIL